MGRFAAILFDVIFRRVVFQIADYHFTFFALVVLLTSGITLAVGVMVLIREKVSRESIFFFLITLAVLLWLFPYSFMYASPNEEIAIKWSRLAYLGATFIPTALFQFAIFALRVPSQQRKARSGWVLSSFFSILALLSQNFISGVKLYPWGYFPYCGWVIIPYLAFFFYMLLSSLLQFFRKSQEEVSPTAKLRNRLFFRAFLIASLGAIEFLPALGIVIPPLGFIPIFSFFFLGAPVIWRYHLVDITPAFAAQEVINEMSDALLVFDREGIIQLVNPAFCQLVRKKEKEIKGLPAKTLLPDLFPSKEGKLPQEGSNIRNSFTLHLESGEELFLEVSLSPIKKSTRETLAWITLIRDMTELRKVEERLSQSEIRYRTIFENTGSATILVEEDMTIALANREFEKLTGFPKEEIEGKRKFTQFFASPDVYQVIEYHQKRRTVPETVPKKYTTHLVDQSGRVREVLASVDLIPQTKQSIASFMDVTDLKTAEKQIAFQLDMLYRCYRGVHELSEALDLEELAQLTVRFSAQEFGVKAAFFLTPQDDNKWELLSASSSPYSSPFQSWLNSKEKDQFLAELIGNGSPLVVNFKDNTSYPQLEEITQKLEAKEAEAFLLGEPPQPWGVLIWLVDKPNFLSSELSGFIQTFIQQTITSGEKARLFSRLQKYIDRMRSLHTIDRAIASSLDLQVVLTLILQETIRHLKSMLFVFF